MVASLAIICPFQPIPVDPLHAVADRLAFIHGDTGPSAGRVPTVLHRFPDALDIVLSNDDGFESAQGGDRRSGVATATAALPATAAGRSRK